MRASEIIGKGRRDFRERTRWARMTTPLHANAVAKVVVACEVSDVSLSIARLEARVQAGLEPRLDGG